MEKRWNCERLRLRETEVQTNLIVSILAGNVKSCVSLGILKGDSHTCDTVARAQLQPVLTTTSTYSPRCRILTSSSVRPLQASQWSCVCVSVCVCVCVCVCVYACVCGSYFISNATVF